MIDTVFPQGPWPRNDFESQYARVFQVAGCRTQLQLAAFLDIKQSSISDAKRRQSIPSVWVEKLSAKCGINPLWIRTGQGGMYIAPTTPERGAVEAFSTEELLAELMRRAKTTVAGGSA